MGNVDQADQLRLQYRIHYWLRNQKWWFAIFFWCYELSLTNCYVLYRHFFEIHDKAPPYSHYEFIREIALAWIDPITYWPEPASKRVSDKDSTATSTRTRAVKNVKIKRKKNTTLTDNSLDPYNGTLCCRLNCKLNHLPEETESKEASCQFHYYKSKSKYRKQLMSCPSCQVVLCLQCYKIFHTTPDLTTLKDNNDGGL